MQNYNLSSAEAALRERYDLLEIKSTDVAWVNEYSDHDVVRMHMGNAIKLCCTKKYDTEGYRFYGEGMGKCRIYSDGTVNERNNIKFGKIKTGEATVRREKYFVCFKKGEFSTVSRDFKLFGKKAERYYETKSVNNAKNIAKQPVFNFYVFLISFILLAAVAFCGLSVYTFILNIENGKSDIFTLSVWGAVMLALSVAVTLSAAILYNKRIKDFRPVCKCMRHINLTTHTVILVIVQFVSMLFIPVVLGCLGYAIAIAVSFFRDMDSFNVEYIKNHTLSEKEFVKLGKIKEKLLKGIVEITDAERGAMNAIAEANGCNVENYNGII